VENPTQTRKNAAGSALKIPPNGPKKEEEKLVLGRFFGTVLKKEKKNLSGAGT